MKYVDASAVLRLLFREPGDAVPLDGGDSLASSQILEVEAFRAVDRERLAGRIDDVEAATKRKELTDLIARLDLATVDGAVIARAKSAFPIAVRALDAIHIATAEMLAAEVGDEPVEFWTHDDRQAMAAVSRGLTVRGTQRPPSR